MPLIGAAVEMNSGRKVQLLATLKKSYPFL